MRYEKMPVWTPLGGTRMVDTIASDMAHYGNRIAEGDIHPSMFWPLVARSERRRRVEAEQKLYEARKLLEAYTQPRREVS